MATGEQMANVGGEVRIGRFSFRVRELPLADEIRLRNKLGELARDALGPGKFFHNALPVAAWLREQGEQGAAAVLLETAAHLVNNDAPMTGPAVDKFAETADGVVEELFWRSRADHPDTSKQELAAIVNDANALDVAKSIALALDPKKAATPAAPPPGS